MCVQWMWDLSTLACAEQVQRAEYARKTFLWSCTTGAKLLVKSTTRFSVFFSRRTYLFVAFTCVFYSTSFFFSKFLNFTVCDNSVGRNFYCFSDSTPENKHVPDENEK